MGMIRTFRRLQRLCVTIVVLVTAMPPSGGTEVWAQEPAPPKAPLAAKQEMIRERFKRFEDRMFRVREKLELNEPDNAAKLERALKRAGELGLSDQLERMVMLLEDPSMLGAASAAQAEWLDQADLLLAILLERDANNEDRRNEIEANSLFELLEKQVVPLFYDRFGGPVPRRCMKRVKHNLATIGPAVLASRMVRDYTEQLYEPAAAHAARLTGSNLQPARDLAAWKARVLDAWADVKVEAVETSDDIADLGTERAVTAIVALGSLGPDDVEVQLVHGSVGQHDEIEGATAVPMTPVDGDASRWTAAFACDTTGRYGFTVRILPSHPDLSSSIDLGRIAWA